MAYHIYDFEIIYKINQQDSLGSHETPYTRNKHS